MLGSRGDETSSTSAPCSASARPHAGPARIARQVQRPHSRQRPIPARQRLRIAHRRCARSPPPAAAQAPRPADAPATPPPSAPSRRTFRAPQAHPPAPARPTARKPPRSLAASNPHPSTVKRAVAQMRKAAVQVDPPPVATLVQRHRRIPRVRPRRRVPVKPLVHEPGQRSRRRPHVNRHPLPRTAPQRPQLRSRDAASRQRRRRNLSHRKLRRQHRVRARDRHVRLRRKRQPPGAKNIRSVHTRSVVSRQRTGHL